MRYNRMSLMLLVGSHRMIGTILENDADDSCNNNVRREAMCSISNRCM